MQERTVERSLWETFVERSRRVWRRDELRQYRVSVSPTGISVSCDSVYENRGRSTTWEVAWSDVESVVAWKTDEFTHDLIWVSVFENESDSVSFPELADGFRASLEQFPRFLSGCRELDSWLPEVAVPAFAENGNMLYPVAAV